MLQETYAKLHHELSLAEEKLRKAFSQGKLLDADRKTLDKGIAKANNSIKVCIHIPFFVLITYCEFCDGMVQSLCR